MAKVRPMRGSVVVVMVIAMMVVMMVVIIMAFVATVSISMRVIVHGGRPNQ
jgi:hypothetical protein